MHFFICGLVLFLLLVLLVVYIFATNRQIAPSNNHHQIIISTPRTDLPTTQILRRGLKVTTQLEQGQKYLLKYRLREWGRLELDFLPLAASLLFSPAGLILIGDGTQPHGQEARNEVYYLPMERFVTLSKVKRSDFEFWKSEIPLKRIYHWQKQVLTHYQGQVYRLKEISEGHLRWSPWKLKGKLEKPIKHISTDIWGHTLIMIPQENIGEKSESIAWLWRKEEETPDVLSLSPGTQALIYENDEHYFEITSDFINQVRMGQSIPYTRRLNRRYYFPLSTKAEDIITSEENISLSYAQGYLFILEYTHS